MRLTEPDSYLRLTDPDANPGGPKTYGYQALPIRYSYEALRYLADSILIGGPAVGGGPGGPRHAQVVVQAGHTLHHVQEDVVAVAGEQLLHEGEVLARLEEQDQAVVGSGPAQSAPDLLHNPSQ